MGRLLSAVPVTVLAWIALAFLAPLLPGPAQWRVLVYWNGLLAEMGTPFKLGPALPVGGFCGGL